MSDYRSLPAWKQAMSLAHDLCALTEECGLHDTEDGRALRRMAIAVPSLIAEAFIGLPSDGEDEALERAGRRLTELAERIPRTLPGLSPDDRQSVLDQIRGLQEDLTGIRATAV